MRALVIGLGGAGCRIAETILLHDIESGVRSVRSYVFDCDRAYINSITTYDYAHKIVLTPIDPVKTNNDRGTDFDVSHLADCFQDSSVDEVDAIFVCAGLGGRMAELVPEFIRQLTDGFPDPVFSILTLPGRNEGARISARASETLAQIRRISSACLIFDNETWLQRLEDTSSKKMASRTIQSSYGMLNELLSRQISLLLRAGEFGENGVDSAEVVLDAGEVLNTLSGMDLVAIGYALEKLPPVKSGLFRKAKMEKYLLDGGHERTSRIVELAKRAVYEDISVPCDLTSANKALILIAGPSSELSMKGFQTVRKWIDRSIKGLEMRAGDYPVQSTRYVGVIIVLAGIENVPRITELKEISQSYKSEQYKTYGEEIDEADIPLIGELGVAEDEFIFEPEMIAPVQPLSTMEDEPEKYFEEDEADVFGDVPKPAEPAGNDDVFGELPKPRQETKTEDADIFIFGDVPKPAEQAAEPAGNDDVFGELPKPHQETKTEDADIFIFGDVPKPTEQAAEPAGNDDVFGDLPKTRQETKTEDADIFGDISVAPPIHSESDLWDIPATPAVAEKREKPRRKDPQIVVGGAKKVEKIDNTIMLPKREKKVDTVLAGQAVIGGNDKPKETDSMDVSGLGSRKRPKEIEYSGVLEGSISTAGSGKRPKETDGFIRLGALQRPKETDGFIRMSELKRPKETNGFIRVGSSQRPKETEGLLHVGNIPRPKDGTKSIRVTNIPLPKNIGSSELKIKSPPQKKKED